MCYDVFFYYKFYNIKSSTVMTCIMLTHPVKSFHNIYSNASSLSGLQVAIKSNSSLKYKFALWPPKFSPYPHPHFQFHIHLHQHIHQLYFKAPPSRLQVLFLPKSILLVNSAKMIPQKRNSFVFSASNYFTHFCQVHYHYITPFPTESLLYSFHSC